MGIKAKIMRRTLALALTAVLALFVLAPYVSLLDATTPACCRRQKAHCSCCQSSTQPSGQGTSFQGVCTHCPSHKAFPAANRVALYPPAGFVFSSALRPSRIHLRLVDRRFAVADVSHPKRGPPSFLA